MKMNKEIILGWAAMAIICSISFGCSDDEPRALNEPTEEPENTYNWAETADEMQDVTYNIYLSSGGTFRENNTGDETFHYWWNAHALDALIDGYFRTEDAAYLTKMKALVRGMKVRNGNSYYNVFVDDMQWLGMACVRAYELTDDTEYLDVAKELWGYIKSTWSDVHGGGLTWKTDAPNGKNACSNAPGAILAIKLYNVENNAEDLEWAKRILAWQKSTLVDAQSGLVWDNIDILNGETVINSDWIFTYNQGTYIGAAAELYAVTGDNMYLNDARKTANTILTSPEVTTEGLLRNENQGDGGLFKGILIRYLVTLIQESDLTESERNRYVAFLKFNAETFYDSGLSQPGLLSSPNWRVAPGQEVDLSTQLSGLMLMEAAAQMEELELF